MPDPSAGENKREKPRPVNQWFDLQGTCAFDHILHAHVLAAREEADSIDKAQQFGVLHLREA